MGHNTDQIDLKRIGNIIGLDLNLDLDEEAKCTLYEDSLGNLLCSPSFTPIKEWLDNNNCIDYMFE
jgi:hypothetical protein